MDIDGIYNGKYMGNIMDIYIYITYIYNQQEWRYNGDRMGYHGNILKLVLYTLGIHLTYPPVIKRGWEIPELAIEVYL